MISSRPKGVGRQHRSLNDSHIDALGTQHHRGATAVDLEVEERLNGELAVAPHRRKLCVDKHVDGVVRPYGYIGKLLAGNAVDIQPVGVTAVTQRNAAYEQIAVVTIVNPETVDGCELASECESKVEGVDRKLGTGRRIIGESILDATARNGKKHNYKKYVEKTIYHSVSVYINPTLLNAQYCLFNVGRLRI